MKVVEPIRDLKILQDFKERLKGWDIKYYIMATLGLNLGLRISDILQLKVIDVKDKEYLEIVEKKTGKRRKTLLNANLRLELQTYISNYKLELEDYLIHSNKKDKDGNKKPISRVRAYQVLNQVAEELGMENIGTHTLRKTFGYHHYQLHKDIALLQEIFNHSSPAITRRYIGINQDVMDKSIKNFYL